MFEPPDDREFVAQQALAGLLASSKTLPAKFFYDDEGCRLFGEITRLPEYYITRTECNLLASIASLIPTHHPCALIEYGASDESKAAVLLPSIGAAAYVPIDVAPNALHNIAARMAVTHPSLDVYTIEADFLRPFALPPEITDLSKLGFFPGSTIGNLDPSAACLFLGRAKDILGPTGQFLVGVDLRKDTAILVSAYNDKQGVTATFNKNILVRLNREAAADFDLDAFVHRAVWNEQNSRIEMHLQSRVSQTVQVAGTFVKFEAGETIHTENSYKHTIEGFQKLARSAGWEPVTAWTDNASLYSLHLLSC